MNARSGRGTRPFRTALRARLGFIALLIASLHLSGCSRPEPTDLASSPAGAPLLGAFVPAGVWSDLAPLKDLERRLGGEFAIAHWYTSWDDPYDPAPVEAVLAEGRVPLITWQPHAQTVRDIAAGVHDGYVREWACGVSAAGGTVYVRLFPEMNGDWTPWNGDPAALRAAWRHVVDIFRAAGADNVRWVFTPNVTDEPRVASNAMELYYPGPDYVDVLGLDGYNWGTTRPYIGWRSYEEVFSAAYERIGRVGSQPIWLAEIASTDHGGDKGAWVEEMLASRAFPRVGAIVWFNENKETDWRIESSVGALMAFRAHFAALRVEEEGAGTALASAPLRAAGSTVTALASPATAGGGTLRGR